MTIDQKLQNVLGAQMLQILALQEQVEKLQAKIAELEKKED